MKGSGQLDGPADLDRLSDVPRSTDVSNIQPIAASASNEPLRRKVNPDGMADNLLKKD